MKIILKLTYATYVMLTCYILLVFFSSCNNEELFVEQVQLPVEDTEIDTGKSPLPEDTPEDAPDDNMATVLKAFPEAEGFGKNSKGGRGGEVFKVTNLNDSGAGSFRAALEASSSSRTIIFEVSGTINLSSPLKVPSNTTIAGQTAFRNGGQGITIKSNGSYDSTLMSISNSDIIIRYIRFRRGRGVNNEQNGDNVTVTSGNNIIFDHCSFSWSTDESFNTWGTVTNLTLQNCIFSESLMYSSHEYTTDPNHINYTDPHSMGSLIGLDSDKISFYQNLFAHNNQRNPLIGGVPPPKTDFELVNNYIYNWGQIPTVIEGNNAGYRINLIGNKWKRGNNSSKRYAITFLESNGNKLFAKGNISPERTSLSQNEWLVVGSGTAPFTNNASTSYQSLSPFNYPISESLAISANDLETQMLTKVGASLNRDAVDIRIVNDVINGTGSLIDDPSDVGGWPTISSMISVPIDTDNDGMTDDYEILKFGNLDRDGKGDIDNDGYTDLEEFLNSII
ncbi:pectate lyase family protein [Confluentibacter lentus]|uniref:pectate lyase family protein n=1 Tax=Confluentibacter lentus TaxID=1699412 RepID=UPI000C28A290|nr:hypothetical protein [Confluentibacter lentus]